MSKNSEYLYCSNCNKVLMEIWVMRPDEKNPATGEPLKTQVSADCPFCGDHSFIKDIIGGFAPGGYSLPKEDDENDEIPVTRVIDMKPNSDDVIVFTLQKV